ncbi:MAG: SusF/SusE family outer membrane protein [Bacteroidales bacterium]|nr:SusF/SusE family outer membrane protein [Bacteroidales bacterium]
MKQKFTFKMVCTILFISMVSLVNAEITELNLVGDAVPAGWSVSNPTPMTLNGDVWEWSGALKAGSLKISTFTDGDWCYGQWLNAAVADQPIAEASYIITEGCDGPDNKWVVAEGDVGTYKVTVNLTTETIVFELLTSEVADVTLSGLTASVGTLTPDFDQSVKNFFLSVPAGTTSVEINATTTDPEASVEGDGVIDLSEGDTIVAIEVTGKDQINKFTYYVSISIVEEGEIYSALYLVGDASPAGWNISDPEPMIQDEENLNLFTWQGDLFAGELKFSTFTGDWCDGDWLLATAADQTLDHGEYTIYTGCAPEEEDFKWRVSEEQIGEWIITVDLENELISFDYQEVTGIEYNDHSLINLYPNPATEYFTIDLGTQSQGSLDVYSVDGRRIHHAVLNESKSIFNVKELSGSGLIILRVSTKEFSKTFRLSVQ